MAYDEGLLERCLDALTALNAGTIRNKNVFGMRGLLRGSTMFAAVGETSMIVKLKASEYEAALAREGFQPFQPRPGEAQKLGSWVEIDAASVADDPELQEWLAAGLRAIH